MKRWILKNIFSLKLVLWLLCLLPSIYTLTKLSSHPDPLKFLYNMSGLSTFWLLITALLIPFFHIFGLHVRKYSKFLGIFSFFYALIHLLLYLIFESNFSFSFILKEVFDKPFILFGMGLFLVLLVMTLTSTKKLYKRYKKLHQLIYLGLVLGTFHYSMAQKVLGFFEYLAIGFLLLILTLKAYSSSHNKKSFVS